MQTLRAYLVAHSWVAMTCGMTTDQALEHFQRGGCDVDAVDVLAVWRRHAYSADDLPKVVRAKLEAAARGEKVWTSRARVYPGSAQFVPSEQLTSGRSDAEAVRTRVLCRVRSDRASVETVAADEGLTVAQVRAILASEPEPVMPKRSTRRQTETLVERLERQDAERRDRHRAAVADFMRNMGRKPPSWQERRAE